MSMITTAILGAGFSHAAGLPLTRDLFSTPELPRSFSKESQDRHREVRAAWRTWVLETGENNAELWLRELYKARPVARFTLGTSWRNAMDFALARLVQLPAGEKAPYYHGITRSVTSEIHRRFWSQIRATFVLRYVVTMNYDILAEQGLRNTYSNRNRTPPACYYGGFPFIQMVRKLMDVTTRRCELVPLGDEVGVFKMHGSLNWVVEPHAPDRLKIHDDVRAVFRTEPRLGRPLIVPPLPEEEHPPWLPEVWRTAREALAQSQLWFVCGYSLPPYDEALSALFAQAAAKTFSLRVLVADPNSTALAERWSHITPAGTEVRPLPGLPELLAPANWPGAQGT